MTHETLPLETLEPLITKMKSLAPFSVQLRIHTGISSDIQTKGVYCMY